MSSPQRASADDFEDGESTPLPVVVESNKPPSRSKPNAFTEIMGTKYTPPPLKPVKVDGKTAKTLGLFRAGLGPYTQNPASFPSSRVVYFNEKFVVINDLFPKASVHLLILPRDTSKNGMQPQQAFDNTAFLADCQKEEKIVRAIVAGELRRKFGQYSATDKPYLDALSSDDPPEGDLPPGRDWDKEIISGIHANPSMDHLHIHVLSRDMVSDKMTKKNHYLSFTTDFLVGLEHFPLAKDDYRRDYRAMPGDMQCWRCGKNFGARITPLCRHLREELEEWKEE